MSTETQTREQDSFITYPLHKVVTVFEDPQTMETAVAELRENGFGEDVIEAFCGYEGEKRMDFTGARHGVLATVLRSLQHIGPDRTYLERYEKHLQDGHCMVMVSVETNLKKEHAARILHHYTGERVTYFGLLAADEIK
ncbi:MAG: hypothetical protein ACRD6X_14710 [Pyrinomonadaceae bacterium]